MPHFCLIVLVLLLRSQIAFAQTGYKDVDTVKYTKNDVITNANGFKTIVFYKENVIRKITREFIGSGFSSITIYYIQNDQLLHNAYASMRKPYVYTEEHMYFSNGKMTKWIDTKNKDVDPSLEIFTEKEKLALKFFEDDMREAKSKKTIK